MSIMTTGWGAMNRTATAPVPVFGSAWVKNLRFAHYQPFDGVRLHDWLQLVHHAAGEVPAHLVGQTLVVLPGKLQVMPFSIAGGRRVDAQHECGSLTVGAVRGAAVDRQGGTGGDVAHLRDLELGPRLVPGVERLGWEHPVLKG